MGMYTELILGCSLKSNTPQEIIDTLKHLLGDNYDKNPPNPNIPKGDRISWMFHGSSYYFAVNQSHSKMWFDYTSNNYRIDARCNIKNYTGEIESFLEWIHPHIEQGSGAREFYAIVTYEESENPTIYYLKDKDGNEAKFPCNE